VNRTVRLGYWLSSEEHPPHALVDAAALAEDSGFTTAMISDHFHPWVRQQGNSAFVWSVLGALATRTKRLRIGTGVTAPIRRLHPAVVAHAAATIAAMMPERFFLGLGSGERLNEHVVGGAWPPAGVRREMLEEAVGIIRDLLAGGTVSCQGRFFAVESAELFTRPAVPPPIMLAASGRRSATLAGRIADGVIGVAPSPRLIEAFEAAGGAGKPRIGQVHLCWATDADEARRTAHRWWPNALVTGAAVSELPRPRDFEPLTQRTTPTDIADVVVCGPDVDAHANAIGRFVAAGFDEIYLHQIGPDQQGFMRFFRDELAPRFQYDYALE
jgi:coenzyme F420-dependent glucose-6-phosphate dehydrogenase